jgi:predicted acyltransferase (DUF342 family)
MSFREKFYKILKTYDGGDDEIVLSRIAEENIYIGYNSRVYGILFTQENIIVNDGVEIGLLGKIKSVVARGDITFGKNCKVYGYIGTERLGLIDPEI